MEASSAVAVFISIPRVPQTMSAPKPRGASVMLQEMALSSDPTPSVSVEIAVTPVAVIPGR